MAALEDARELARLMGLLANENRLLILCRLMDGPAAVGELNRSVPHISASALSQHLQTLRSAGLVEGDKQGQYVVYRIKDPRLSRLFGLLRELYCPALGE